MDYKPMKISVVLPCLNEEKTIGACIEKIKKAGEERERETY
jgi:glycosyltransferase involved in cell wall biosynthesis